MTVESLDLLSSSAQAPLSKQVELGWLKVSELVPHPKNPRIGRPDKLDSIIESMRTDGYRPEKPMLVRPYEDGYQIIGGHSRYTAATTVGIEQVLCAIEDMDDETAILRIAQDNINDPLPWYSICLYVVQNSIKDSKKGLSRTALISAATGKTGNAAEVDGRAKAAAGEVIVHLQEQSVDVHGLLNPEENKTFHLYEIKQAPIETWKLLFSLHQENSWSVKETKAAVDRVRTVADLVPDWLPDVSSVYPKVAMEPGYAKSTAAALKTAVDLYNKLPEKAPLFNLEETNEVKTINGREFRKWVGVEYDYQPRNSFVDLLLIGCVGQAIPDIHISEKTYKGILARINEQSQQSESWEPIRTEQEEWIYQDNLREMQRITMRELYTPKIIHGDALDKLRGLARNSFDLVCVDPPYNMDKADWDSYGSGKAFAEWARPWLKECQRVLKDSGSLYLFGINRMLSHIQHTLDDLGMEYRNWITWDTIQGAGGGIWVNRYESILYYSKTRETYEDSDSIKLERHEENVREYKGKEYAFKDPSNVWRIPCVDDKHAERTIHPTQKPVELIERIIKASSPAQGNVLDCFIGSGTTGVACMKNARFCTGIEMNADYISIAQSRFAATEVCK